jgi:outer membrane protein TolC
VEVRFNAGETSELDVEQAKTELAKTSAQAPELENGIVQATNPLAVLLGVTPGSAALVPPPRPRARCPLEPRTGSQETVGEAIQDYGIAVSILRSIDSAMPL